LSSLSVRTAGTGAPAFSPHLAAALLAPAALVAGGAAGSFVASGRAAAVLGLALVLVPALLWLRPELGPVLIVFAALTVEQFPEFVGENPGGTTAKIPLFYGYGGLRPADVLVVLVAAVCVAKHRPGAAGVASKSGIGRALTWLLVAVTVGLTVGLTNGGVLNAAVIEVRPYVYLAAACLIASRLVTTRHALRAMLWAIVIATGLKACQGLFIFLQVRHDQPRPQAVLGHEESLFFGLFIFLTAALWIFEVPGRLRTVATILLPVVIAADMGNGRRVAWLIVFASLIVLIATAYMSLPRRRPFLRRLTACLAVGLAIYLPAFWDKTGGLAQPARAIRSGISSTPNPRDAASNLYRLQEDANLRRNIAAAGPLGTGFGVPIIYDAAIVDISDVYAFVRYVPHNGVLYLFLRMGIPGAIAFWSILGVGILAATRLARSPDREIAVTGALVVCALVAYALLGYNDQGFFYYRVALVIGTLLGITEALTRAAAAGRAAATRDPTPLDQPRVQPVS
jgi:hypothetical protein